MSSNSTNRPIEIGNTIIHTGGVYRCCLLSVAEEYGDGRELSIGSKSKCAHCKEPFTLIERDSLLIWIPDWQLDKSTDSETKGNLNET